MFAKVLNYFILVFLLFSVKAPFSWGFSVSRTSSYQDIATKLKLSSDAKWLNLGHYEKKWTGYKSAFRGPLFISPKGFESPEAELVSTIDSFFSDSVELTERFKRHPQCQFLARRNWLVKKLNVAPEDILPCEERETWKKQLNATSASLIFAASDLANPASGFGHTFLKLINPENAKNKDLIDYGVNYAAKADATEGVLYAVKGLFGLYGGTFTMLPYHQKIREYINLEGRDIWEYTLDFTPAEVDELVNHLLETENSSAPYYFFSDNCSYQILFAFDVVRPELNLHSRFNWWAIPIDTVKTVERSSGLIQERKYKKSIKTDYIESFSKLGLLQKKALDEALEKKRIPDSYELSPKEKAEVYETATKYLAVKAYRTGEDLDEQKYNLSKERARLGAVTQKNLTRQNTPPDQSHDSSALYFGFGQSRISDYTSLKFRAANHDLEQPDTGAVPMSQNNLGAFELRYYSETKKFTVEKFTLLNLINTNPVTQLDKNISWKVRAELLDAFRPDAEFSGGMSFDFALFQASRISYLLTARYLKAPAKHTYQAGPEILFVTRPTEKIGISADLSYFGENETLPYTRLQIKLNYSLNQSWDLQIQGNDQQDYQLSLLKNFIF